MTRGPRDNPLHDAFVKAGEQAGYPVTSDYNGEQQEGFGPMEMTVYKGRRWSAANAYLKPALKRENCDLIRAFARKVVIEDGRAVGVEIERGGKVEVIRANREVILAASSLNSPKMLMLSGIGPAKHLAEHGIEVVADRPGVGRTCRITWNSISSSPPNSRSPCSNTGTCWARPWVGRAVAVHQDRPWRLEPVRKRGLHPLGQRCGLPGYPVPLPAHRGAL